MFFEVRARRSRAVASASEIASRCSKSSRRPNPLRISSSLLWASPDPSAARMRSGHLTDAPVWDDVRTLTAGHLPSDRPVHIISAAFPCPDLSDLGTRRGVGGERSGLFFQVVRLARETRAHYLYLENVPDILHAGIERVCQALHQSGYDCRWSCVAAADVGAPHARRRWFCLARRRTPA